MKILLAIDDEGCSINALEFLLERCWSHGDQFRVITVKRYYAGNESAGSQASGSSIGLKPAEEESAQLVEKAAARIKLKWPACEVTTAVLNGDVTASILDESEHWRADLLVLGSHGRRGAERLFAGSVSAKVASNVKCSLLVVATAGS